MTCLLSLRDGRKLQRYDNTPAAAPFLSALVNSDGSYSFVVLTHDGMCTLYDCGPAASSRVLTHVSRFADVSAMLIVPCQPGVVMCVFGYSTGDMEVVLCPGSRGLVRAVHINHIDLLRTIDTSANITTSLAASPQPALFLSASFGPGTVCLHRMEDGAVVGMMRAASEPLTACLLSQYGDYLFLTSGEQCDMWHIPTCRLERRFSTRAKALADIDAHDLLVAQWGPCLRAHCDTSNIVNKPATELVIDIDLVSLLARLRTTRRMDGECALVMALLLRCATEANNDTSLCSSSPALTVQLPSLRFIDDVPLRVVSRTPLCPTLAFLVRLLLTSADVIVAEDMESDTMAAYGALMTADALLDQLAAQCATESDEALITLLTAVVTLLMSSNCGSSSDVTPHALLSYRHRSLRRLLTKLLLLRLQRVIRAMLEGSEATTSAARCVVSAVLGSETCPEPYALGLLLYATLHSSTASEDAVCPASASHVEESTGGHARGDNGSHREADGGEDVTAFDFDVFCHAAARSALHVVLAAATTTTTSSAGSSRHASLVLSDELTWWQLVAVAECYGVLAAEPELKLLVDALAEEAFAASVATQRGMACELLARMMARDGVNFVTQHMQRYFTERRLWRPMVIDFFADFIPTCPLVARDVYPYLFDFFLTAIDPHNPSKTERMLCTASVSRLLRASVVWQPNVAFQQYFQHVAIGLSDGSVKVYNLKTASLAATFEAHNAPVLIVSYSGSTVSHDIASASVHMHAIKTWRAPRQGTSFISLFTDASKLYQLSSHLPLPTVSEVDTYDEYHELRFCRVRWLSPQCIQFASPWHGKLQLSFSTA